MKPLRIDPEAVMRTCGFLIASWLSAALSFGAEVFPSQPVRMIVAFVPGGGADLIARLIAPALADQLGTSVIVENRGGAGGRIGAEAVAKAAPAGYALLLGETGFVTNPGF